MMLLFDRSMPYKSDQKDSSRTDTSAIPFKIPLKLFDPRLIVDVRRTEAGIGFEKVEKSIHPVRLFPQVEVLDPGECKDELAQIKAPRYACPRKVQRTEAAYLIGRDIEYKSRGVSAWNVESFTANFNVQRCELLRKTDSRVHNGYRWHII